MKNENLIRNFFRNTGLLADEIIKGHDSLIIIGIIKRTKMFYRVVKAFWF